jgi:tetratricopeptide (TPR) repeat protein
MALDIRPTDAALEAALIRALVACDGVQGLGQQDYVRLQRAAQYNGDDPELQLGLAVAAKERGDHETAIVALEAMRRLGRGGTEVLREIAALLATGNVRNEHAERLLREAAASLPEDLDVMSCLSDTVAALGRTDPESLTHIRKALIHGVAGKSALLHLLTTLLDQGKHGEALSICATARPVFGDSSELQRLEAQAILGVDRIEDGIRILESLVQKNPTDQAALLALADAYYRQRVVCPEVREVLLKSCEFAPEKRTFRLALGRCEAAAGEYALAIPNLKKAAADPELCSTVRDEVTALVAQNPDQPSLRWFLTTLLIDQNRLSEAVSQLERIREIDPTQHKLVATFVDRILAKDANHLGATILKGRLQFAVGNLEGARKILLSATDRSPGNPLILGSLVEVLQESIQSGADPSARIALGRALMQQEKWEAATEVLQVAAQDYRLEAEAGRLLGECYMRQGMLDYALQHLRKQPSDPQLVVLITELAGRFEASEDIEGAKQAYKHCLVIDPNNRVASKRLQSLAGITQDPLVEGAQTAQAIPVDSNTERYDILEDLGRGAMGIVFKAHDRELDELVAIKILPDNLSENSKALARFKTEARSARRLAHPNIVRIHDLGEARGRKFISMEYIDGMDLRGYLKTLKKRLNLSEVHGIIYPVALALDYAHTNQIVHRDIKPANIMITRDGVVKVSDFGIAKILQSASETMIGAIVGTPIYMSPEQITGQPVDHRTDIYALGIMMYELISGRPPFHEGDLAYQHVHVPPAPIPNLPVDVWNILLRALAKKREDRFATAGEMAAMMESNPNLGRAVAG